MVGLVVDFLFIITSIVGVCNYFYVLLYVTLCPFLYCNLLGEEERAGCFA